MHTRYEFSPNMQAPLDRSPGAKIQKNDDCLRGVTHQSGTSVGLSLGEDVVGELDCDLDGKSEML